MNERAFARCIVAMQVVLLQYHLCRTFCTYFSVAVPQKVPLNEHYKCYRQQFIFYSRNI